MLIQNAEVVTHQGKKITSLRINQNVIQKIDDSLTPLEGEHVIDGEGLLLLPGGIDPHVHFREPGFEDKENLRTGSIAAVTGGITSYFDMPNTKPATTDLEALKLKKERASETSLANYNFFFGAVGMSHQLLKGDENIPGIKLFLAPSTGDMALEYERAIEALFAEGSCPIVIHAEDPNRILENQKKYMHGDHVSFHVKIRDSLSAIEGTRYAVKMAKKYKRQIHLAHLTTKEEVDLLEWEKEEGLISAEVCPQHFLLSYPEDYDRLGNFIKVNPPVRTKEDGHRLFEGLKKGIIDFVATDHAPHLKEEKTVDFIKAPSGMPGIETLMPLMLNLASEGKISYEDVVKWTSTAVAKVFHIKNKGFISEGFDADLVLVDKDKVNKVQNTNLATQCKWSAFEGWSLKGWPKMTIVNGHIAYDNGVVNEATKGVEVLIRSS